MENRNLEKAEGSPFQKARSVNISKGGELWGIRFFSTRDPTIKTTNKDGSSRTPIRIDEEDTSTKDKDEEDMVRLNKNPHLKIVLDVALVLEKDL